MDNIYHWDVQGWESLDSTQKKEKLESWRNELIDTLQSKKAGEWRKAFEELHSLHNGIMAYNYLDSLQKAIEKASWDLVGWIGFLLFIDADLPLTNKTKKNLIEQMQPKLNQAFENEKSVIKKVYSYQKIKNIKYLDKIILAQYGVYFDSATLSSSPEFHQVEIASAKEVRDLVEPYNLDFIVLHKSQELVKNGLIVDEKEMSVIELDNLLRVCLEYPNISDIRLGPISSTLMDSAFVLGENKLEGTMTKQELVAKNVFEISFLEFTSILTFNLDTKWIGLFGNMIDNNTFYMDFDIIRMKQAITAYKDGHYALTLHYCFTLLERVLTRQVTPVPVWHKEESFLKAATLHDLLNQFEEKNPSISFITSYAKRVLTMKEGLNLRNNVAHGNNISLENANNAVGLLALCYLFSQLIQKDQEWVLSPLPTALNPSR